MSNYSVREKNTNWLGLLKAFWKNDEASEEIDDDKIIYDGVTQEDIDIISKSKKRLESIEKNYTYTYGDNTSNKKARNKKARKRIFQGANLQKGEDVRAEQKETKRKEKQKEASDGKEIAD